MQLVTSAFRVLPEAWATQEKLNVVVSIDGLQPEHDERRKPATYERILKNIAGQRITVHSTITSQMLQRPGYLEDFLRFWTVRPEVRKVWFSLFTPQIGDDLVEMLTPAQRQQVVTELLELRTRYPKLDMPAGLIKEYLHPPASPEECVFSQTTKTISADFKTTIEPCQLGGNPDCGACGCIASAGLKAIADHRLFGFIPVGRIFNGSIAIGRWWSNAPAQRPVTRPAPGLTQIQPAPGRE